MLNSLAFEVTFPATGRHFKFSHDFSEGMTAITGANEAGKSLQMEMVRYFLFGSDALRGTAPDYASLDGQLEFQVKSRTYRVSRKKSKALLESLNADGVWQPEASGTTAVNLKVPEIFGYGLKVFDAAHAVNQGQVEALGAMTATERRRMVDNVIGLDMLDDLIKMAGDEANTAKREIDAVRPLLIEPLEPVKPEGYLPSADLKQALILLQAQALERAEILGWMKQEPVEPEAPQAPSALTTADLEAHEAQRQEVDREIGRLQTEIGKCVTPSHTAPELTLISEQLTAYEAYMKNQQARSGLPPPSTLTAEQIGLAREKNEAYDAWKILSDRYLAGHVDCPSCGHGFVPGCDLDGSVLEREPERGSHSDRELDQMERARHLWEKAPAALEAVAKPDLDWKGIQIAQLALENFSKKADLEAELAKLKPLPNLMATLKESRAYDTALVVYQRDLAAWEKFHAEKKAKEARLTELGDPSETLIATQTLLGQATSYETSSAKYITDLGTYQGRMADLQAREEDEKQHRLVRAALGELKVRVKSYLVPSLNAVASRLLFEMTGGSRSSIEIDEDFNISVDGQALSTLSGSGKAVANLAIRIGLGQVLTNKTFSVFIADEIDASMDTERAEYTAQCLRRLTSSISQIFLVSHKRPEADNHIEL